MSLEFYESQIDVLVKKYRHIARFKFNGSLFQNSSISQHSDLFQTMALFLALYSEINRNVIVLSKVCDKLRFPRFAAVKHE